MDETVQTYGQGILQVEDLPVDILLKIFSFLTTCDRILLSRVSKSLHNLLKQQSLWRSIDLTGLKYPEQLGEGLQILKSYTGNYTKSISLGSIVSDNILQFVAENCPNLECVFLRVRPQLMSKDVDLALLSRRLKRISLIRISPTCSTTEVQGCRLRFVYLDRGYQTDNFVYEPFPHLERLSLHDIRITHRLTSQLCYSKQLYSLTLDECVFTESEHVHVLTTHLRLTIIHLNGCCFQSNADLEAALSSFATNVQSLTEFGLGSPKIASFGDLVPALQCDYDTFLDQLKSNDTLSCLLLTDIHNITLRVFNNFLVSHQYLETLYLVDCFVITDKFIEAIALHLSNLLDLNLHGCDRLAGDGLRTLSHHTKLRKLNVSKTVPQCNVSKVIRKEDVISLVAALPALQFLTLSHDLDCRDDLKEIKPYLVISSCY